MQPPPQRGITRVGQRYTADSFRSDTTYRNGGAPLVNRPTPGPPHHPPPPPHPPAPPESPPAPPPHPSGSFHHHHLTATPPLSTLKSLSFVHSRCARAAVTSSRWLRRSCGTCSNCRCAP